MPIPAMAPPSRRGAGCRSRNSDSRLGSQRAACSGSRRRARPTSTWKWAPWPAWTRDHTMKPVPAAHALCPRGGGPRLGRQAGAHRLGHEPVPGRVELHLVDPVAHASCVCRMGRFASARRACSWASAVPARRPSSERETASSGSTHRETASDGVVPVEEVSAEERLGLVGHLVRAHYCRVGRTAGAAGAEGVVRVTWDRPTRRRLASGAMTVKAVCGAGSSGSRGRCPWLDSCSRRSGSASATG